MLLILFGVLYYITRNYLHRCHKLKVGTHQESCFRDKSLSAQRKFSGKVVPATCGITFNFSRSRSMSRRQKVPRTPYAFVFSPRCATFPCSRIGIVEPTRDNDKNSLWSCIGKEDKLNHFPRHVRICETLWLWPWPATFVCYTSLLHASSFYCTWVCACCICLLHITVCAADFIIVARSCSNSLQPVSSCPPTFNLKFTPKL